MALSTSVFGLISPALKRQSGTIKRNVTACQTESYIDFFSPDKQSENKHVIGDFFLKRKRARH